MPVCLFKIGAIRTVRSERGSKWRGCGTERPITKNTESFSSSKWLDERCSIFLMFWRSVEARARRPAPPLWLHKPNRRCLALNGRRWPSHSVGLCRDSCRFQAPKRGLAGRGCLTAYMFVIRVNFIWRLSIDEVRMLGNSSAVVFLPFTQKNLSGVFLLLLFLFRCAKFAPRKSEGELSASLFSTQNWWGPTDPSAWALGLHRGVGQTRHFADVSLLQSFVWMFMDWRPPPLCLLRC